MVDTITEVDYVRELDLIRNEINTAIECFYTYLEIHRYAAEERLIHSAINTQAAFWNITLYSLQATFFLTLGRIFDDGRDSHSIHKLLVSTVAHPEFFSKEALSARRRFNEGNLEWLDEYVAQAFEPSITDLRELKKTVSGHRSKYDSIYSDIRNFVFAHKITADPAEVEGLFSKAVISDADQMLYGLFDVVSEVQQMLQNGRCPQLGIKKYDYQARIRAGVRETMNMLLK